ncbi:MAG: hypothetical protein NTY35_06020 [Planctomycetota bacterium]|nr:hypothetical protein [Planctomycetota bacterium]
MRTLLLMSALGLGLAPAKDLVTEYKAGIGRKVTIESSIHMETTSMEVERDGEKMPGMGGATTDTERTEVHIDHVVEADAGKPTKVRRHFVELGGKSAMEMGENSRESEIESPWKGVTVQLTSEGGKVEAEVVAGTEPDGEGALEGHAIGLFLDGFLPKAGVEEGAEWEIGNEAILRGLRLDVQRKLYPPPARPDGEGRGAGGGGGRRGGRMGGGGDSFLTQSEWKGTGKLAGSEEKDGVLCAIIELELETSGERELEAFGGRGPRALNVPFDNRSTWSAKLEGKLWFDVAAKRPMLLELEGTLKEESRRESERDGSSMKMSSTREGKIDYSVEIEDAPAEETKPEKKG